MPAQKNPRFLSLEAAAMDAASRGIQALLILNGGAAVATLGLLGSLAASANLRAEFFPLLTAICRALMFFAGGAALATLGWFIAYFTNQNYANALLRNTLPMQNKIWRQGQQLNKVGFWVLMVSFIFFLGGVAVLASNIPDFSQPAKITVGCGLCLTYA